MAMASKLTPSFLALLASTVAPAACKPGVGQPAYLVTDYALLAVRGEPAEAKPGATVSYDFLLASPGGTVASAEAEWEICQTPKPPSESNAVSSACTGAPDAGAANAGQTFTAPIPGKACQLFGPIAPPPVLGQPAVRPRDADGTGGYYLPVHVWLPSLPGGGLSGFALERISCNLANAPSSAIADYNNRYQPNVDPAVDHVDLVDGGGHRLSLDAGPQPVATSTAITIEATLGAGSAEMFPVFNQASQAVEDQQESLSLSWFVTGGSFEHDRTGVAAGDPATTTSNRWTAPIEPGIVHLWLVLRDSRGGAAFKSYQIEVAP
jgi:hypothetical protein